MVGIVEGWREARWTGNRRIVRHIIHNCFPACGLISLFQAGTS